MALGLVPAAIVGLVLAWRLALPVLFSPSIAVAVTPFAESWHPPWPSRSGS